MCAKKNKGHIFHHPRQGASPMTDVAGAGGQGRKQFTNTKRGGTLCPFRCDSIEHEFMEYF